MIQHTSFKGVRLIVGGLLIVVSCHVEPGTCRDLEVVFDERRGEGIDIAVPRIAEFADGHRIPMTFAMTPTALSSGHATSLDGHEVGLHLHPQDRVLRDALRGQVSLSSDCLAHYSREDQSRLIGTASQVYERATGRRPRVFVAGRWSESSTTANLLAEAGFRFDGSPLPGHVSPCADWGRVPRLAQPFHPSPEDYQSPGSIDLLYVPVTRGLWGFYLTPEIMHILGPEFFKAALHEATVGGSDVVHVYFHSPMAVEPWFLATFSTVVEYAQDRLRARFAALSSVVEGASRASRPFPPAYFAHLTPRLMKSVLGRGRLGQRILGTYPMASAAGRAIAEDT